MKFALLALIVAFPMGTTTAGNDSIPFAFRSRADSIETEMKALALRESSGGKNLNHARIDHGVMEGDRAGGFFGMMPKTVQLIIKIDPSLHKKYRKWLSASSEQITKELNRNRKMDRELSEGMWRWLRKDKTVKQAACAWFWGPWAGKCAKKDVSRVEYVQLYMANYKEVTYVNAENP